MFCVNCNKELEQDNVYCTSCGTHASGNITTSVSRNISNNKISFFKYATAVAGVVLISFVFFVLTTEEYVKTEDNEEWYESSMFDEMSTSLKPVGYFDDMTLFDNELLSTEEWFSHLQYHEGDQPENYEGYENKEKIFASVVKIVCEDDEYFYYGSGTNVDPSGYVLTNYHVVDGVDEDACIVGFPNPNTGLIEEVYWTTIITDKANETGHDLAYLAIEEPVFDEEGNAFGYYDRVLNGSFPYFKDTDECLNTAIKLGDELLILGYPPLSGEALTVTNGLVSSLYSQDGYIITSAKIVSGNSGGLAIDQNECYIGVPTATYYENEVGGENLGEVIDAEFVFEFDKAIEDDLNVYYESKGML